MNSPVDGFAYLNLIPDERMNVDGILIPVTPEELELLTKRERGYSRIDVTKSLIEDTEQPTFCFVSPDIECRLKVPRSYILTCTVGMSDSQREEWLAETVMGDVEEDADNPVYENAAL